MIVIVGAGVIGTRIARELAAANVEHTVATRATPLAQAVAGARVVIDAAAPLRDTAVPVLEAALAAGAHYVDVGGEQPVLQELIERHDAAVRRAGVIALPGAGVDCVLGDLALGWAAAHLCGVEQAGDPVRTRPADRIADDQPLDEACASYVFDDLVLSAGSQRALFGAVGHRPLVWRRDRWEPGRIGDRRRVNAGAAMGGERDANPYASGEPLTVPRHVAANLVAGYASTTRKPASGMLMRLLSTAAPLLPRAAADVLAPYAPDEAELSRTRFAVVAQVRRGFSAAQITIRGVDLYRASAAITAWVARALATRGPGPLGIRAPGELFVPAPALRALAAAADLTIEPSFGTGSATIAP